MGMLSIPSLKCSHVPKLPAVTLSAIDLTLKRNNFSARSFRQYNHLFGHKWSYIFSAYFSLLPKFFRPFVLEHLLSLRSDVLCESCFITRLKDLTTSALSRIISGAPARYLYLLDLHTLGGFDTELNRVDVMDTVFADYCTPSSIPVNDELCSIVDNIIRSIKLTPRCYDFKQFVSFRDSWANPGTSNLGQPAKLVVNGKKIRVNNKWFSAISLSDEDIIKECETTRVQVKPFLKKDEPAKTRVVQAYDTRSIIRCSFLDSFIANVNGCAKWTTIGDSPSEKLAVREDLLTEDKLWRLCTDQSSFDINQPKWLVMHALKSLIRHISRVSSEAARIGSIEIASMEEVFLETTSGPTKWEKGVLSGHKWTALLDSILNRAETEYVMKKTGSEIVKGYYQGDDAIVKLRKEPDLEEISKVYASLGLSVNQMKTWVSRDRCEFLHEIYMDGRVHGLPARLARALVWRKPATGLSPGGEEHMNINISNARKAARRGLDVIPFLTKFMKSKIPRMDMNLFRECLATPVSLGGLGFGSGGRVSFQSKKSYRHELSFFLNSPNRFVSNSLLYPAIQRKGLETIIPIPGITTTYYFQTLSKHQLVPMDLTPFSDLPRQRLSWGLSDYRRVPDPYIRKLILEKYLYIRDDIPQWCIPPGPVHYHTRCSSMFKILAKWSSLSINLEDASSSAESWSKIHLISVNLWANILMKEVLKRSSNANSSSFQDLSKLSVSFAVSLLRMKRLSGRFVSLKT